MAENTRKPVNDNINILSRCHLPNTAVGVNVLIVPICVIIYNNAHYQKPTSFDYDSNIIRHDLHG